MRRRGKAKRALGKGVSSKARKVPIARGSTARVQKKLDRALRERDEALEQQAATAEVLNVISGSPGQLEPVFQTILANATRICGAKFGTLYLRVGDSFRAAAFHGPDRPPGSSGPVSRVAAQGGQTPLLTRQRLH